MKPFRRGLWGCSRVSIVRSSLPTTPKAHRLTYTTERVTFFYHFGSAKNNIKFRLFCPFLTIPLRIIYSNVLDYPDIPLTDGRMVTLLYTLRNFNAESDNKIHVCLRLLSELLLIMSVISWTVIHRQQSTLSRISRF